MSVRKLTDPIPGFELFRERYQTQLPKHRPVCLRDSLSKMLVEMSADLASQPREDVKLVPSLPPSKKKLMKEKKWNIKNETEVPAFYKKLSSNFYNKVTKEKAARKAHTSAQQKVKKEIQPYKHVLQQALQRERERCGVDSIDFSFIDPETKQKQFFSFTPDGEVRKGLVNRSQTRKSSEYKRNQNKNNEHGKDVPGSAKKTEGDCEKEGIIREPSVGAMHFLSKKAVEFTLKEMGDPKLCDEKYECTEEEFFQWFDSPEFHDKYMKQLKQLTQQYWKEYDQYQEKKKQNIFKPQENKKEEEIEEGPLKPKSKRSRKRSRGLEEEEK